MNNSTLVDYIKAVVELNLSLKGATPEMIKSVSNTIPVLASSAIVRLQRKNILPPKEWRFVSGEYKEEQRRIDGSVNYNYYKLPEDFRELKDIFVEDNGRQITYHYEVEDLIKTSSSKLPKFTIKTVKFSGGINEENRLVMSPFPSDDKEIIINYYETAHGKDFRELDQTYWDSVSYEVLAELGLKSEYSVDSEVSDMLDEVKHKRGKSATHKSYMTRNPKYFCSNKPRRRKLH